SSAVPATAQISNAGSLSIIRDRTARATVESSTSIRRIRLRERRGSEKRSRDLASARSTIGDSGDADELELDVQRLAVEGLHDIFVRSRFERRADMGHVVLGRAEHDFRLIRMAALAKQLQELHPAHDRHVPVEEDDVGHLVLATRQGLLSVAGLVN